MLAAVIVMCLLVLATAHTGDPDLWGHVRYGQEVLASGRLPATATHTYTAPGHAWINHENLSEIIFAALVDRVGPPGLTGLTMLLGLAVLVSMVWRAVSRGVRLLVILVVGLLAACNMGPGWSVRPQVFTYTLFALLLIVLDDSCATSDGMPTRWQTALLWLAPLLFAVWANAHGGFLAGLGVLGVYLGCQSVIAFARCGARALPQAASYAGVVIASVAATFLNPYGTRLLTWLIEDLGPPRPEISEWNRLAPPDPLFFVFVLLLGVTVVAWVGSRKRRDAGQLAVLAITALETIVHARHAPFFGIAAGFWVPVHLEDFWRRRRRQAQARPRAAVPEANLRRIRAGVWTMTIGMAALLVFLLRTLWVGKAAYPVDALQYLVDRGLSGKLVADFNWAQYAIAALPDSTVAFDGRLRTCYPQNIADLYFDFLIGDVPHFRWRSPSSPAFDDRRILTLGEPDLALLNRGFKHSVAVMEAEPDWILLYQDGVAQVWGRRAAYDDPASPRYVPPPDRHVEDRMPSGYVRWPAFPIRRAS